MSDKFTGGVKAGSTSVSVPVSLRKVADSTELTGVAFGSVTASYRRQGAAAVAITAVALPTPAITDAWTSGGWIETSASLMPGTYRLDVPDAAFLTGADWVIVGVKVATAFTYYERFNLETAVLPVNVTQILGTTATASSGGLDANLVSVNGTTFGGANVPVGAVALTSGERTTLAGVIGSDVTDVVGADVAAVKVVTDKVATTLATGTGGNFVLTAAALINTPPDSPDVKAGVVVAGSTGTAVVLSGLPAGKTYTAGQKFYQASSGETRVLVSQSFASGNYTFNFSPGFSAVTTGELVMLGI